MKVPEVLALRQNIAAQEVEAAHQLVALQASAIRDAASSELPDGQASYVRDVVELEERFCARQQELVVAADLWYEQQLTQAKREDGNRSVWGEAHRRRSEFEDAQRKTTDLEANNPHIAGELLRAQYAGKAARDETLHDVQQLQVEEQRNRVVVERAHRETKSAMEVLRIELATLESPELTPSNSLWGERRANREMSARLAVSEIRIHDAAHGRTGTADLHRTPCSGGCEPALAVTAAVLHRQVAELQDWQHSIARRVLHQDCRGRW